MSILVNGTSVESVSYSPLIARTTLSTALAGCFPPARNSAYLITVVTGVFGSHSLSILCDISPHAATHIVLGREWGALLRDSLLANGIRVGDTFNAWTFLTHPTRPLSATPSARLQTSPGLPPNSSHLTPIDLGPGTSSIFVFKGLSPSDETPIPGDRKQILRSFRACGFGQLDLVIPLLSRARMCTASSSPTF
ncbi:hypothetical protein FB451DRAFT_1362983 [Mycena latifolia]|nr:hypothetical protein FB451DRAFT_1362983 [Mycena latifolia]